MRRGGISKDIRFELKVKQRGQHEQMRKLMRQAAEFRSPRGLYARWGVVALKWIAENFREEGGLLHDGPWEPLRPSTVARRRKGRGGGGHKILQDTGILRASFVKKDLRRGVAVGSPVKYSDKHEKGATVSSVGRVRTNTISGGRKSTITKGGGGTKVIPQRRMLPTEEDSTFMQKMLRATRNWIKYMLKGA